MDDQMRVETDCQVAVSLLVQALEARKLRVYCSFNLRTALAGLAECGCPYHGTSQCTCQYAVLLVYGDAPAPVRVVAHGRDGWVHLTVPDAGTAPTALRAHVVSVLLATLAPYMTVPPETVSADS
ncbi:MAG: hypothetical protein Kow00120_29240 [Anaerolineae bacterium]